MWHFPLLNKAKDAITALAKYASEAVVKASNTLYVGFTDAEVNKQRFNLAVSLVMDNPKAVQAAKDILSKVFLGFLMKLTPVASTLVGLAVELAYQSFKAATAASIPPALEPAASFTSVAKVTNIETPSACCQDSPAIEATIHFDAPEPGNESMIDDHAIGFHTLPHLFFPFEQAEPGDTQ